MSPYCIFHLTPVLRKILRGRLKNLPVVPDSGVSNGYGIDSGIALWLVKINRLPFVHTIFSCAGHKSHKIRSDGHVEFILSEKASSLWKDRYLQDFEVRRLSYPQLSTSVSFRLLETDLVGLPDQSLEGRPSYLELWRVKFHERCRNRALDHLLKTLKDMRKERGLK